MCVYIGNSRAFPLTALFLHPSYLLCRFPWFLFMVEQVLKLRGEIQYRKTLITNNGSPTGAGTPVGIAVDPARG